MVSRYRPARGLGLIGLLIVSAGCSDWFSYDPGSLRYIEAEAMTRDLGPKPNLHGKPKLQAKVREAMAKLYGPDPQLIRIPEGAPLMLGGRYLASHIQEGDGLGARVRRIYEGNDVQDPDLKPQAGGYAIYRRHCLHCHGVSGAGDGPTSPFLFPRPRDFRRGIFKFTSTPTGARPHRDDLCRTIVKGLEGTSMPAFEPILSPSEIEQVVDYVMFLSVRGETELALIEEASISEEGDEEALAEDIVQEIVSGVFNRWKSAQSQVINPAVARTPPTRESILRGRDLFLASDCKDCHGRLAKGDGASFVETKISDEIIFGGDPSKMADRVAALPDKVQALWKQKLDDWGDPLRPANLNKGKETTYKGGRRPIDIYWRIAKGINGAQMPGHYPSPFDDKKMWDIVNFVLALPYEPELLTEAPASPTAGAPAVADARPR